MMKVLLLSVSFIISLSFGFINHPAISPHPLAYHNYRSGTCEFSCAQPGQECAEQFGDGSVCTEGYYCHYIDDSTRICKKKVSSGMYCNSSDDGDDECRSDQCSLYSNTCIDIVFQGIGQKCVPYDEDKPCMIYQAYCNISTNTCQPLPAIGENCYYDYQCAGDAYCGKTINKCVEMFSQQQNQSCYEYNQCLPGLMCTEGMCNEAKNGSHKACKSYSDCEYDEYCRCYAPYKTEVCVSLYELESYTESQAQAVKAYLKCLGNSGDNCLQWTKDGNNIVCDACKKEICDYKNEIIYTLQATLYPEQCRYYFWDYQIKNICDGVSSKNHFLHFWLPIIAGGIVLIVLIIALIVWRVKRGGRNAEQQHLIN